MNGRAVFLNCLKWWRSQKESTVKRKHLMLFNPFNQNTLFVIKIFKFLCFSSFKSNVITF